MRGARQEKLRRENRRRKADQPPDRPGCALGRRDRNSDKRVKELIVSIEAKEAERVGLIERVRLLQAGNVASLHRHVVATYRENIEKLHTGLCVDVVDPEVVGAFRNVTDSIVV